MARKYVAFSMAPGPIRHAACIGHSRKSRYGSSSGGARRSRAAEAGTNLLLALMLLGSGSAVLAQEAERKFDFNIPPQAVDTALTEFAEQADLTLVFPDELVREKSANALVGRYRLQEGVDILLAGTGLASMFSNKVVLSISVAQQSTSGEESEKKTITEGSSMIGKKVFGLSLLLPFLNPAMTVPAHAEEYKLEEVLVTARKRSESIDDVPISISAFSEGDFEKLNIGDIYDVGKVVPNFTVNNFGNGNLSHAGLFIRGIGIQDHWITTDPGVGAYLDGVYLGRQIGANLGLLNIERVEVARGPQGTLYGRNSIGGAVNFITRRPDETAQARVQLQAGSLGRIKGDFYGSTPLSDTVAVSLAASLNQRDGVGDFISVPSQAREVGEIDQRSARLAASFTPSDRLSLLLSVDMSDDEYGQQPYFLELFVDPVPGFGVTQSILAADPDDSTSLATDIQEATYEGEGYSATLAYDISDEFDLKVIASRRESEYTGGLDLDSPIFFTFPEEGEATQNSAEVQLNGTFQSWNFVAGFYYFDEDGEVVSDSAFGLFDTFQNAESRAVYGSVTIDLADKLALSGGLRYTEDEKDANAITNLFGGSPRISVSDEWDAMTWDISLKYDLSEDLNLYGAISHGYQSGGFPARAAFGPPEAFVSFDEQLATNYEMGLKGSPSDIVQLALSVFFTDYTDLQLRFDEAIAGGGFLSITDNAGESESFGVEMDATLLLGPNFRVRASLGYLDAEVTQVDAGTTATKEGDKPFFSPEWTISIAPEYAIYLNNGGSVVLSANYSFRDEFFAESLNSRNNLADSRSLLDVNAAYYAPGDAWRLSLYGENITDEVYENTIVDNGTFTQVVLSNDREEYGVRFTRQFGRY